jgi:glutamine synthetase
MHDFASLKHRIEEEGIDSIDFRVADLAGRFRHLTIPACRFTESAVNEGFGFDGSNYGYRHVSGSDMILIPDLSTAYVEVRGGESILTLISDICDAKTRKPASIDPRGTTAAAVEYLEKLGIADGALVSPEFEFYLFDEVLFDSSAGRNCVEIVPAEGCAHTALPGLAGDAPSAYHAPLPHDRLFSVRCEMVRQIESVGIPVKYHHHEVGPFGQHEIELGFDGLAQMADAVLVVKSLVHNVSSEQGLTATFLPKPMYGQAGNGMHLHQYLVQGERNLFLGDDGLSELALCYVGGLLTHGASLMALTNPTTNSYRRLVPGYEAPVSFVFGGSNRTAAIRIPAYAQGEETRVELRTMDATCNPYISFPAILLAGIDGIQRSLNARELGLGPFDGDMQRTGVGKPAPRSLDEALDALEADRDYLLAGDVFTEETLDHWIRTRREEAAAVAARPHPHEFALYCDL